MTQVRNNARGHFFDQGSTRFFNSRYPHYAYLIGKRAYFITSEKFEDLHNSYSSPRLYTVRVCNFTTGDVDTVDAFQKYRSHGQAVRAIKEIIKKEEAVPLNGNSSTLL